MEAHVMSENAALPPGDPLQGAAVAGRWSFGYDMPDDLGGGFVSGELLLRTDGVLLRRYGGSSYRAGQITWQFKPWEPVTWWSGETDPRYAVAILKGRGYDLCEPDPVPIDQPRFGPVPGRPTAGKHL
jgi:hypothetical protein